VNIGLGEGGRRASSCALQKKKLAGRKKRSGAAWEGGEGLTSLSMRMWERTSYSFLRKWLYTRSDREAQIRRKMGGKRGRGGLSGRKEKRPATFSRAKGDPSPGGKRARANFIRKEEGEEKPWGQLLHTRLKRRHFFLSPATEKEGSVIAIGWQ